MRLTSLAQGLNIYNHLYIQEMELRNQPKSDYYDQKLSNNPKYIKGNGLILLIALELTNDLK